MPALTGYRTSFPTALPGGRAAATGASPVGYALPGTAKKAIKSAARRRKKATGFAYAPVGRPTKKRKRGASKARRAYSFSGTRGGSSSTAISQKEYEKAAKAEAKAAAREAKRGSTAGKYAKKVGDKALTVVSGAVGRALFPGGIRGAKQRARTAAAITSGVKKIISNPAVRTAAKATAVAGAGIAAYELTRRSRLGGRAGDAVVEAYFKQKDRSEAKRMAAFRAALAAERRQGPVSSQRVKALASTFGFSTSGAK